MRMKRREKKKNLAYFTFPAKIFILTECGYETMDTLIPRFPLHISECIISFLEFEGDYTSGELQVWAELNSYSYLKRRIAKKISIVLFIEKVFNDIMVDPKEMINETIERYLKKETVELLSRCTNSFFFLIQIPLKENYRNYETPNMDEDERRKLENDLYHGSCFHIVDVFNFFGQTPRKHPRHLELLYSFEFMRLMKQRKCNPESMYVIVKSPTRKRAIMSLFSSPELLLKGQISNCDRVLRFTNPRSYELGDFADKLYIKYGYQCKIESFWMRLFMALKIMMDSTYGEKNEDSDFLCV